MSKNNQYFGLQSQIWKNNTKSTFLLIMFPGLIFIMYYIYLAFTSYDPSNDFIQTVPVISISIFIWFIIAYKINTWMIKLATDSRLVTRKEEPELYNLLENLCISVGMKMPKLNIIEDDSLNAFASGINEKTYTISVSRGLIHKLNKQEIEAVLAHELTHIRNRDVRLLIVSIIFVGIFSFIAEIMWRRFLWGGSSDRDDKLRGLGIIIGVLLAFIGYFFAIIIRFAISRSREYLADAGSAEITKNPSALISALEKISKDPVIEAVKRDDIAQMFIENPEIKKKGFTKNITGLFATHPPIKDRIKALQNM